MSDLLCWIDLETTGGDETRDSIIEIGVIFTDQHLDQLTEGRSWTVRPTDLAIGRLMREPVVYKMHKSNGLLDEILERDLPKPHQVTREILSWLDEVRATRAEFGDGRVLLAGSGVGHFDRRFLNAQMPELARRFHYGPADIGNVRRFFDMWGLPLPSSWNDSKTHRALDDIVCHLHEARAFRDLFREVCDAR